MIYDINGNALSAVYDSSGNNLQSAFDINGNLIFSADRPSIKVMSYNVGQWYYGSGDNVPADKDADYYALQNGMIANANADILCINEYWNTFSKTGRTALSLLSQYYPYIEARNGGSGYFGRAICSKYPISNYTTRAYTAESSRYYDSCTITIEGISITIVVTHLGLTLSNRELEIAQLISFLQTQERFIACGDYNMLDCKTTSGADYLAIMEPILNAGFRSANCADFGFIETYSDVPSGTYTGCLDNIVTSANISIISANRDNTKLNDLLTEKTDHMPFIAELSI